MGVPYGVLRHNDAKFWSYIVRAATPRLDPSLKVAPEYSLGDYTAADCCRCHYGSDHVYSVLPGPRLLGPHHQGKVLATLRAN